MSSKYYHRLISVIHLDNSNWVTVSLQSLIFVFKNILPSQWFFKSIYQFPSFILFHISIILSSYILTCMDKIHSVFETSPLWSPIQWKKLKNIFQRSFSMRQKSIQILWMTSLLLEIFETQKLCCVITYDQNLLYCSKIKLFRMPI